MSNPNVILVQSLYAAFLNGQIDTVVAALMSDVEWEVVGRPEDYPAFGPRKGGKAVKEFFKFVADNEEFAKFSPREFYPAADRVFVLGNYSGKIKKSGRRFAADWVHVFTIKDGKVSAFREHTDMAQFANGAEH